LHTAPICIAGSHPALPGHFPGMPVVPGVIVLDRLMQAAETRLGRPLDLAGIPQVKFLAPLLPGEEARGIFELDGTRLRFRVERDGQLIAQGAFALAERTRAGESAPPAPEAAPGTPR
jgi:3-hydroxyacyl-[acyl-carrier-protein] dehydratase